MFDPSSSITLNKSYLFRAGSDKGLEGIAALPEMHSLRLMYENVSCFCCRENVPPKFLSGRLVPRPC